MSAVCAMEFAAMVAVSARHSRKDIDFHKVEEKHNDIHRRLQNWAKWCNGREATASSPMFRMYRSTARARGAEHTWALDAVDAMDAQRIAKAVAVLPHDHRKAINWAYVKPVSPRKAAAEIGCTLEGLALFLRDGRQMLVNRGA
jgi:DNA-directed RNA polymerase specialized sigma24 family protein